MSTTRWWWAKKEAKEEEKKWFYMLLTEYNEKSSSTFNGKFWNFWPNFIHLKTFFFAESSAFIIVFNLYFSPDYMREYICKCVYVWSSLCSFFYIYSLSFFILSFSRWSKRITSGEWVSERVLFYDFAGQLLSLYWFIV